MYFRYDLIHILNLSNQIEVFFFHGIDEPEAEQSSGGDTPAKHAARVTGTGSSVYFGVL